MASEGSGGGSGADGGPRWGRVLTAVFLLAAVGSTVLLLFGQWQELQRIRARVDGFGWRLSPTWVGAALSLATLNLFLMGGAWVRLYRGAGGTLSYGRGVRVWVATNLARYIPGKVWHISGLAVHLKRTGESGALALATAITFQVVTLLTGSAVAVAVLGADVARVPTASPAVWAAGLGVLALLLHPRVVGFLTRLAARITGEDVDRIAVAGAGELLVAGLLMTAAWGIYGIGFWCLLEGVARTGAPAGPLVLTGIFAAAYVAGYLVLIAPGGLVVREGAMTALLAGLTPIGAAVAAAVSILARIWAATSELVAFAAAALTAADPPPDDADATARERRTPPGGPTDNAPGHGSRGRDPRDARPAGRPGPAPGTEAPGADA